jgi:sec-independent protein translocase protein TatA
MGLDNPIHIAFLLIVLLLVFGAKRLPEMGRSLGSGMRGFRDALSTDEHHHASLTAVVAEPVAAPVEANAPVQAVPVATPVQTVGGTVAA